MPIPPFGNQTRSGVCIVLGGTHIYTSEKKIKNYKKNLEEDSRDIANISTDIL